MVVVMKQLMWLLLLIDASGLIACFFIFVSLLQLLLLLSFCLCLARSNQTTNLNHFKNFALSGLCTVCMVFSLLSLSL